MKYKKFSGKSICSIAKKGMLALITVLIWCPEISAEDWPTYNHDNKRSCITGEHFNLPLYKQWTFNATHKPAPAWPAPAPRDIWHKIPKLNPRVTYDRAFHVAVAGNALYFSSSADDKVYSLDTKTGNVRWSFFTGGPVRLAPAVYDGKVYAGSDNGYVYCLDSLDGELVWSYNPDINRRKIPGNGRMISACPVRTGLLIEDDTAYFCAGVFPGEGVELCALDAHDGSEIMKTKPENLSPQGYLLSSKTRLYIPTGRTTPVAFDRKNGELLGTFSSPHGDGGTYALITDDTIVSGPGKELVAFDTRTNEQFFTFAGMRMIVNGETFFLLSDRELSAFGKSHVSEVRKKQYILKEELTVLSDSLKVIRNSKKEFTGTEREHAEKEIKILNEKIASLNTQINKLRVSEHTWKTPVDFHYSMILADDLLFCGGDGFIAAFDTRSGERKWTGNVNGKAYGLAAANGNLFVSTDKGTIHCFSTRKVTEPRKISIPVEKSPYPRDGFTEVYVSATEEIVKNLVIGKGYCLVLGCGEGRLMYELAKRTEMQIIGIDDDRLAVEKARKFLDRAGLYGTRVSVELGSLSNLPFTDYFANLIVSEQTMINGKLPGNPDEVYRVLRPFGGIALFGKPNDAGARLARDEIDSWLGKGTGSEWNITEQNGLWVTAHRGPLVGCGKWTHQFAEPGNTASSADVLVKHPVQIQWFGRPGPHHINDRHHRPMAPLSVDGRLFVIGNDYLFGMDSYNGTILWEKEVPGLRRIGAIRDCGHVAAASDFVYLAVKGECWGLDTATGEKSLTFTVPRLTGTETPYWGYIAYDDEYLFGTAMKKTAPRTELSYETILGGTYFDSKPIVASDYLFCFDRHTGKKRWIYKDGVILNPAIAIGDNHVFLITTINPTVKSDSDGRVLLRDAFTKGCGHIVKIDKQSGDIIWDRKVDFPYDHAIYLSYKNDMLLAMGTYNKEDGVYYGLYGIDAITGEVIWNSEYKYGDVMNGDHGEQDQHPVIIGNTIYSRPYDFDLRTGRKGTFNLDRGGHGCGTISGSTCYLFGRGGNPRMYDISTGGAKNIVISYVNRPGCFINMIPACGLILLPESSSGCVCSYPMQTSIAYIPVKHE